jgi:hypothetical protein
MILNASDYARELKRETRPATTGALYWLSILPPTVFMGLIGLMVSGATGNNATLSKYLQLHWTINPDPPYSPLRCLCPGYHKSF